MMVEWRFNSRTVHLFGAGSSPEFSNLALKRTAEDSEREFGARTDETLRKNFYVDDALKSVPTENEAACRTSTSC